MPNELWDLKLPCVVNSSVKNAKSSINYGQIDESASSKCATGCEKEIQSKKPVVSFWYYIWDFKAWMTLDVREMSIVMPTLSSSANI